MWLHDGRIFVSDFTDLDECIRRVTKVFGVHSVCPAVEMPTADFEAIAAQAVRMMDGLTGHLQGERPPQRQAVSDGLARDQSGAGRTHS